MQRIAVALAALLVTGLATLAQAAPLTAGALGRFVGTWAVTGETRGRPTETGAEVREAFGGAFLELHIKDPSGRSPYEARVFFGQDEAGGLVIHWLDATGGATSKTLGAGRVTAEGAAFAFPYPDGVFRDRLTYDAGRDTWRLLIQTGPENAPETFSDWTFRRADR